MSRKFLTVVISLLILAGCSLSGVSRASRTAFAEEVQKLSASYPQPKDMSAEDWANESVLRAKKQLAMQSRNPDFLTLLAEEESLNVLTRVAKNPKTPLKILEKFSTSDVLIIRNYLAANTALSEKLLDQLSRDKEPDVRQAAAANPKNTEANLKLLAADENPNVEQFLARNPQLSEAVMLVMVEKSQVPALEILLKKTGLPASVVTALKNHPDESIRTKAAAYPAQK